MTDDKIHPLQTAGLIVILCAMVFAAVGMTLNLPHILALFGIGGLVVGWVFIGLGAWRQKSLDKQMVSGVGSDPCPHSS